MKKLLYTSLIALAGLFAASCQQEHIEVVYDPANVTVQTLGVFADAELAADGAALTTTFNPADFKLQVASGYALYASKSADMSDKVKVSAAISIDENNIGHISIKQPAMNSLIFSLGGAAEEPFTVYFQLEGGIANAKKTTIAATVINSNVVAATFTPYSTIILDKDLYPHVYPIGGIDILGSWSHDKVFQFVYDYNKSTDTYTGLLDLGEKHADGVQFKFTGEASWDDSTGNWGVDDDSAPEAEAGELQLKNGSNTNISQYGKDRFYMFSLNTTSLVLTKKYSFSNVGIVGAFNNWAADDANMKMTYNDRLHRFYIDQTFAEDTELKFTCDDKWDLNWGGTDGQTAGNGANIAVEAGSYRVYLDLNKGTYELSASMFGKDEPTGQDEPEPVVWEGWGVVGTINNWSAPDIHMTAQGDFWIAKDVEITVSDQFKFRKDEDWAENIGASGDVEPFVVELGTKYEGAAGGKNLGVAEDGKYDLYVNPTEKTFYVMAPGEVPGELATWGVVGTINSWGGTADLAMSEENGMMVRKNVALTTSDQIKVRYQNNWDVNRGAPGNTEPFIMGADAIQAVAGGKNLGVAEDGEYDVWYDNANEVLFVLPAGQAPTYWGVVGNLTDWGGTRDYLMYKDGDFYVHKSIEMAADVQFKVRYCSNWDVNRGAPGDVEPYKVDANTVVDATAGGKNLGVNEAGAYDIYYNPTEEKLYVMAEGETPEGAVVPVPTEPDKWGLVGSMTGWSADGDIIMSKSGSWYIAKNVGFAADDEFKIRGDYAWTFERGAQGTDKVTVTIGEAVAVVAQDGKNMVVPTAGTYDVYWDTENEKVYVMTAGETPEGYSAYAEFIYAIGGDTDWSSVYPLRSEEKDGAFTGKYKGYGYLSQQFKFKPNADNWDGDWECVGEGQIGQGSDNCPAPATAGFYMIDVDLTAMTYQLTLISTVGIIGPAQAGGWETDTDLTYNATGRYWEASNVVLAADDLKFRANDNWDIDWGGSLADLRYKGGNISVSAGTFNVKVYLICDTKSKVELTPAN